jgi:hypothetical protein
MREVKMIDIVVHLHVETEKAALVSKDGNHRHAVWLPKGKVNLAEGRRLNAEVTVGVPDWLAKMRGLVDDVGGLVPISPDGLPAMVGKAIHLSWASRGCVWILDRIEGDRLHLHTPKTGRRFVGKASDACYTRQHEPKESYDGSA